MISGAFTPFALFPKQTIGFRSTWMFPFGHFVFAQPPARWLCVALWGSIVTMTRTTEWVTDFIKSWVNSWERAAFKGAKPYCPYWQEMFCRLLPGIGSGCWVGDLLTNEPLQGWSWGRLFQVSSARLFCSTSQFDCCVRTCANEPSQKGNAPLVSEQRLPVDAGVGALLPSHESVTMTLLLLQFKKKKQRYSSFGSCCTAWGCWIWEDNCVHASVHPDDHPEEAAWSCKPDIKSAKCSAVEEPTGGSGANNFAVQKIRVLQKKFYFPFCNYWIAIVCDNKYVLIHFHLFS